jgi:hypothetical protein
MRHLRTIGAGEMVCAIAPESVDALKRTPPALT